MNEGAQGPWEGKGHTLEAAMWHAWENAKSGGADPGTYKIEIMIEAHNPIHSYIVVINPPG
ncbi:MAG TPA: hypothetical protein VFU30_01805 [Gaiellaceae bacterium]|nr:hypothetical protein [Gaiellaceae bacterium]